MTDLGSWSRIGIEPSWPLLISQQTNFAKTNLENSVRLLGLNGSFR
jgi:hypothetical protein